MARFYIPTGKEPDTCETVCAHKDCAETRRMLSLSCRLCGSQMQGGDAVVADRKNTDHLVHWACELADLPKAPNDVRAMLDRAIR